MKSFTSTENLPKEFFYKICVVGGGLTGAIMLMLLKKSKFFNTNEISWVKPKIEKNNDLRTTFYNQTSIDLLKKLGVFETLKKRDIAIVKRIEVYGKKDANPLVWDYSSKNDYFGAVIKNKAILNSLHKKLKDIEHHDSIVTNTTFDDFERTIYLKNKTYIKANLVLSADGKNSQLRKLLAINTIEKKTGHIAISGFLKQSKNHNSTALQAFTELGPVGILPFENENIINFVFSIEKNKYKQVLSKVNSEQFIADTLSNFFSSINLSFEPINKINNIDNSLSNWPLDLNFIMNPTSFRALLIGDAAHSIHPLAGQGLNLSMRDCVAVINSIENSLNFGNDLGDEGILDFYKKNRLPNTIAMTAFTDLLFYGFTKTSKEFHETLSKGMENINESNVKNIFKYFASR